MPVPPGIAAAVAVSLSGGAASAAAHRIGARPSREGTVPPGRKSDAREPFPPAGMFVETHPPRTAGPQHDRFESDPLAGEDEPWAEDFLRSSDEEDYISFLRTLWVAILASALFWAATVVGAITMLGAG